MSKNIGNKMRRCIPQPIRMHTTVLCHPAFDLFFGRLGLTIDMHLHASKDRIRIGRDGRSIVLKLQVCMVDFVHQIPTNV